MQEKKSKYENEAEKQLEEAKSFPENSEKSFDLKNQANVSVALAKEIGKNIKDHENRCLIYKELLQESRKENLKKCQNKIF